MLSQLTQEGHISFLCRSQLQLLGQCSLYDYYLFFRLNSYQSPKWHVRRIFYGHLLLPLKSSQNQMFIFMTLSFSMRMNIHFPLISQSSSRQSFDGSLVAEERGGPVIPTYVLQLQFFKNNSFLNYTIWSIKVTSHVTNGINYS